MDTRLDTIEIDAVDLTDTMYVATFPLKVPQRLLESIAGVGMIVPPLVEKINGDSGMMTCRVVCGWRRVAACRKLGKKSIPAHVTLQAGSGTISPGLLLASLHDNITQRSLNLIEQAHILRRLSSAFGDERTLHEFMPLMGISKSWEILRRYLLIPDMEEHVKEWLVAGSVSLKEIDSIAGLPPADLDSLIAFMNMLAPGVNLRREIHRLLVELSRLDNVHVSEIIQKSEIPAILESDAEPSWKIESIRHLLRTWRYPELSKIEGHFHEKCAGIGLPPAIELWHPEFYEEKRYTLGVTFEDSKGFEDMLNRLEKSREKIMKMLDDINGMVFPGE